MHRFIFVFAVALATLLPTGAYAQFSAATGFPVGEKSRIHTGLDLLVGLDFNSKRFDDDSEIDGPRDDFKMVIRPQLLLNVPGDAVTFDLKTQLSLTQFLNNPSGFNQTTVGGNVEASLRLGSKDSLVSFQLDNQLVRTPAILDEVGSVASDERRFPLWHNRGAARLTLRPGGRALELDIGGYAELTQYDDFPPASSLFGGVFEARWRFFPKTALVFHADIGGFTASNDINNTTVGATPLHVTIGARGQVTPKITAELAAGYGDTLSSTTEGFDPGTSSVIGTAILSYQLNDTSTLRFGYRRRVEPIVILNSYSSDAPFVTFTTGFINQLTLRLYGEYDFRSYANSAQDATNERRSVQLASADVRLQYWFFEFLNASVMYRLQLQSPGSTSDPSNILLQDFTRHQLLLNVGLYY